ncbi:hypothetical protein [Mycobacterium sp. AZCC_0083]|uniref:hypothetical protein n=1 Tax=Mycobacterium sp. AZCC_0083 TaxID=2735882 RepID=UPI00161AFF3B|nr:hypothetical protein [Mycobacterium sp. AZCC_0083]MBB5166485.1 hypothetical protein [Mycobacterium sp. AZCC_0083]
MAPSAPQRPITAVVLALMILGLLTSCGAGEKSSTPVASAPSSSSRPALGAQPQAAPPSTTRQTNASGAERLGCGTYCQSAGQYGAPGEAGVEAVTILSSGTIPLDADGYVPLTLKCNLPVPCTGAILACADSPEASSFALGCGRSEEVVDAGATRTLGVPLTTPALGTVHTRGSATVNFLVDNSGVPRCENIPQLAAQCAATFPTDPNYLTPDGIIRPARADVVVTPPTSGWGSQSPADEAASHQQLRQLAAGDRPFVSAQLADRWMPQLSSKQPGTIDNGFTWDDTLTLYEHQRLRDRYGAKLVWSGDWASFDVKDAWVTIAPTTFTNADGALGWCYQNGFPMNYCAAKLVSATHPPAGAFAHQ